MNGLALMMLGVVAASLAGSIAWQLGASAAGEAPMPVRAAPADARPQAAPAEVANQTASWAATSLARPLFRPDRRPPAAGAAGPASAEAPLPRLTGILITPEGRSAIFAGRPQAVVLREGGRLGGFTVQSIEAGQVTLLGPDGPRWVRPSFDSARPAAAAAPGPPAGLPLLPGAGPSVAGSSPPLPDGPKDAMPFDQNPAPSGLDILRNQAGRPSADGAPVR